MKNIVKMCLITLILLFSKNAFADSEQTYIKAEADNKTGIVTVSASSEKNSMVGIYILNPGVESLDDMTPDNAYEFINYAKQGYTDQNGELNFSYKLLGDGGKYKVYLSSADGTKTANTSFIYVSQKTIDGYISEIEKNRDRENKNNDLEVRTENIKKILGTEYVLNIFDIYEKDFPKNITIDNIDSAVYENMASYDKECKEKSDVKNMFFGALYAKVFSDAEATDFAAIFEECKIYLTGLNEKVYSYYTLLGESRAEVDNMLEKYDFHSASDIENALNESVILYGFKKMSNYTEFMPFVKTLDNAMGLDLTSYADIKAPHSAENVDKAMLEKKNSINSVADMQKEFKNQIDIENAREIGGTSQKGSGGSGKTIGSSIGIGTVLPDTENAAPFDDLDAALWAKDYILKLYDKKIISGYGDKTFRPNDGVKREEAVKIIVSSLGLLDENASAPFEDVNKNEWYAPYIGSAYKFKIVSGIDENNFGTGKNVSRQDMAVMIFNLSNTLGNKFEKAREYTEFKDGADIADYAKEAVKYLYCAKILNGDNLGNFNPTDNLTRAETAALISAVLNITGEV